MRVCEFVRERERGRGREGGSDRHKNIQIPRQCRKDAGIGGCTERKLDVLFVVTCQLFAGLLKGNFEEIFKVQLNIKIKIKFTQNIAKIIN